MQQLLRQWLRRFKNQGEIDFGKLPQLVDYLLANHTEGVIFSRNNW